MSKAALVVLADTDTHEGLARAVNALVCAKEFKEAGDEVTIVFDGAGTRWVPELARRDHVAHGLFEDVRDKVAGACAFCAGAFGVRDEVEASGIAFLDDYANHPSLHSYVSGGYAVITF